MNVVKQTLALVLAGALILSFSTITLAIEPTLANIAFYHGSLSAITPIHGSTHTILQSYNDDMENPGWVIEFVAEDYPKSITLSNTTDFSAEIFGTAQPHPEDSRRILFAIFIDFLHNPYTLKVVIPIRPRLR